MAVCSCHGGYGATVLTYAVLQSTLKFINGDAASVHGVVRASSVFTSESGEWKLGGFDILSSMNDENAVIYVSIYSSA